MSNKHKRSASEVAEAAKQLAMCASRSLSAEAATVTLPQRSNLSPGLGRSAGSHLAADWHPKLVGLMVSLQATIIDL